MFLSPLLALKGREGASGFVFFSTRVCKTGGDESGNRTGSTLPDSSFVSSLNRGPPGYNGLFTLRTTGDLPSATH